MTFEALVDNATGTVGLSAVVGLIVYLMTIRQQRAKLDAQAGHTDAEAARTRDEGSAAVVTAVGEAAAAMLQESVKSLPLLQIEVARMSEALSNERRRGDRVEADLVTTRAELLRDREETADLHRWADEAVHWMKRAFALIDAGKIDPPPDPPARRWLPPPPPAGPVTGS